MIKTSELTPEIYSRKSRDFQLLGHLFDATFNNVLINSKTMGYDKLSSESSELLLELAVKTLGFELKRNYLTTSLYGLVTTFKEIIKRKGSLEAIEMAIKMLLRSQDIDSHFEVIIEKEIAGVDSPYPSFKISIYIPKHIKDWVILEDLMDYILPSGYIYEIYFYDMIKFDSEEVQTEIILGPSTVILRKEDQSVSSKIVNNYRLNTVLSPEKEEKNNNE